MQLITVVLIAGCVAGLNGQDGSGCPDESWRRFENSCYFMGEDFPGGSYYETAAFCRGLGRNGQDGAYLMEINSMEEFLFIQTAVKNTTYKIGPWIGMIRPNHNSRRFQLPTTLTESGDPNFDRYMEALGAGNFKGGDNCVGFDKNGNGFGYWNCSLAGSPLCEMKATITPVVTAHREESPKTAPEGVELREGCPQLPRWTRVGKSCYFLAADYPSVNYFQAAAFCQGFGRNTHLAELNSLQEKDDIRSNVFINEMATFMGRAWVGVLRAPNQSKKYVLPASLTSLENIDMSLHQYLRNASTSGFAERFRSNQDKCGQFATSFDTYTHELHFADCKDDTASPLCEISLP